MMAATPLAADPRLLRRRQWGRRHLQAIQARASWPLHCVEPPQTHAHACGTRRPAQATRQARASISNRRRRSQAATTTPVCTPVCMAAKTPTSLFQCSSRPGPSHRSFNSNSRRRSSRRRSGRGACVGVERRLTSSPFSNGIATLENWAAGTPCRHLCLLASLLRLVCARELQQPGTGADAAGGGRQEKGAARRHQLLRHTVSAQRLHK